MVEKPVYSGHTEKQMVQFTKFSIFWTLFSFLTLNVIKFW